MPDVSVILPVFNAARTIARAVHSILSQTLREIELIVLDDGSTDETVAVVREFHDPRLRVIQRAHQGVAAAANAATGLATAPLIARMDADDIAYPSKLEKQRQLLHKRNLDAVGCQVRILNEVREPSKSMQRYERWINEDTVNGDLIRALRFIELPLVNPTILARRGYFELGYRENEFPEDYDLMLRAAAQHMRFGKVNEVLFDWMDYSDRLTRTNSRYTIEAFMRCRQSHLLDGPLCRVGAVDLWGIGQTGKPWLRWLQSHNIEVRHGYDVNQRKLHQRIHGVRIAHPVEMPVADGTPLVIAVGTNGARELIRPHIDSRGYVAGRDAWFVA